ncbi:MAG: hypothetical protein AAF288_14430 [Planctomycetota bacterium]
MAAKETSPLVEHIEKIALAAGLGVLGLVFVLFFTTVLGDRFAIGEGAQKKSPADAVEEVERAVEQVRRGQQSDELPDELAELSPSDDVINDLLVVFDRQVDPSLPASAPAVARGPFGPGGLDAQLIPSEGIQYTEFAEVRPPLAEDLLVRRYDLVFDASAVVDPQKRSAYLQRVGNQLPADFPMVTVAGYFDFADWAEMLRAGDGENPATPTGMWNNKLVVTGVYLVRSERSTPDEPWSDPVVIEALPDGDQLLYRESQSIDPDAPGPPSMDRPTAQHLEQTDLQRLIRLPTPPPTAGDGWRPPRLAIAAPRPGAPGFNPGAAGFNAGAGNDVFVERTNRRLDAVNRGQLDGRDARDARGGGTPPPVRRDFGAPGVGQPLAGAPGQPAAEADPILAAIPRGGDGREAVWAHDLSVEYGKTYRYRLVVNVVNPLYAASGVDETQKATNYDKFALGPDPSGLMSAQGAWSDPITIPEQVRFFFTDATPSGARVVVRRVYDGEPREFQATVDPGDAIGAIDGEVDFQTGAVAVDVVGEALETGGVSAGSQDRLLYLDADGRLRARVQYQDVERLEEAKREAARMRERSTGLAGAQTP